MISVSDARAKILSTVEPLDDIAVSINEALNRVLRAPAIANLTQPPLNCAAMDGYAVTLSDAVDGQRLTLIGEAPAGRIFPGSVQMGEAVRIFTGGVMPQGTDHVVIQEDVTRDGNQIEIVETQYPPRHVRQAGIDFKVGDTLLASGTKISSLHLSVLTAANIESVCVSRRPKVAVFANGDELRSGGTELKPGEILSSTPATLCALLRDWGADVVFLGIIPDDKVALSAIVQKALSLADIIVPLGGASVGDYDYIKETFSTAGFDTIFDKIAVKPGKPTWFATRGGVKALGLPGNPASGLACAFLFLKPLVESLLGHASTDPVVSAVLTNKCPANGPRESYLRGRVRISSEGQLMAEIFSRQDSSLLTPFSKSNALIQRTPDAKAATAGDRVSCLLIDSLT